MVFQSRSRSIQIFPLGSFIFFNSIYGKRMYLIMKPQDRYQYQYDPTITAPKIIFQQIGSNAFYVNSNCILATKKIITIGKEYAVVDNTSGTKVKMREVILVDCYYKNGIIHLIVRDIRTQRVFTLDHALEYPENECSWVLIDINYFIDRMNTKAVQSYCGCCNDPKRKSNSEISHKSNHDDLLEFEF